MEGSATRMGPHLLGGAMKRALKLSSPRDAFGQVMMELEARMRHGPLTLGFKPLEL